MELKKGLDKMNFGQHISPLGKQGKAFPSSLGLKVVAAYSLEHGGKGALPSMFPISLDLTSVSRGRMLRTEEVWLAPC